jgi:hypothetical protein
VKPKRNYSELSIDNCQTPPYAVDPILKWIPKNMIVWEPAKGKGFISDYLISKGYTVKTSDIEENFFNYSPDNFDCIITNPPYSIKYKWIERCYELKKPFALLMPFETWAAQKAQKMFINYGINVVILSKRVNFYMPNAGFEGKGAQFPVAWFMHNFDKMGPVEYAEIQRS